MNAWYQINQRLFRKEQAALEAVQPGISLEIRDAGFRINQKLCVERECAIAAGVYSLKAPGTGVYDYRITVVPPDNYPASPCLVFCDDPRLPIGNIDRHILSDGQACLAVPGDLRRRWKPEDGIAGFLDQFVSPFLAWQVYYDVCGCPPPWGQRAHGVQGIIDFYAEALGLPSGTYITGFIPLFARKNPPKGHEICPCGSGFRLRHCHIQVLSEARSQIPWKAAQQDLSVITRLARHGKNGGKSDPILMSTTNCLRQRVNQD